MLRSSDFNDPDGADTYKASQWQITKMNGDYHDPYIDTTAETFRWKIGHFEFSRPINFLSISADQFDCDETYYWRVRHQDDLGLWSEWSEQASFKTIQNAVLLVHGFHHTGWEDFNDWWDLIQLLTGLSEEAIGDISADDYGPIGPFEGNGRAVYVSNYSHPVGPEMGTHANITHYAKQLSREIHSIILATGGGKVDIVAHSQGGLVSRAYIESADFSPRSYWAHYRGDVGEPGRVHTNHRFVIRWVYGDNI